MNSDGVVREAKSRTNCIIAVLRREQRVEILLRRSGCAY